MIASSGLGCKSELNNPNQRDFSGNVQETPLMATSTGLNIKHEDDDTRFNHNIEDGYFPVLKSNY